MPSSFPGMDPYIEHPEIWSDFHGALAVEIRGQLNSSIRPRYVVRLTPYTTYETVEIERLDWKNSNGAIAYDLELRRDSTHGALIANPQLNVSEYKPATARAKKQYFWRVRACNADRCSGWSAWWNFTIQ